MTTRGVIDLSTTIQAPVKDVWRVLVEPEQIARWMGGARVESTWEIGSEITFSGKLLGKPYRDHGTVREIESQRLLRYDHWSRLSRLPDAPGNRSVITLRLDSEAGGTRLSVRHEYSVGAGASEHSNYFWRMALEDIKRLADGRGARSPG